jgi:excisionase family DNA binding protein
VIIFKKHAAVTCGGRKRRVIACRFYGSGRAAVPIKAGNDTADTPRMPSAIHDIIESTPLALRPAQAAKHAGVSRSRLYELLKRGEVEARRDGRCTLILESSLRRWVASRPVYRATE